MSKFPALILLFLLVALPAIAREIPAPSGYVNDTAGLLSQTTAIKLEQFLRDFERSDSTQIVLLTIDSLKGDALEDYTLQVLQDWGIGQKEKDNGALLLIAKADRKVRIEVGYGLEGRLTDLLAGRIIDNEITPRLKQGDFDGGIAAGLVGIAEAVRGEYQGTGRTSKKNRSNPFGFLFLLFFIGPFLARLSGRGRGRSRRGGFYVGGPFMGGGGGFGGGGFSGGGGGGGGGGASGGW